MRVGDRVLYKDRKAEIIEVKWGLYCIRFDDTQRQIWVSFDGLTREDFKWNQTSRRIRKLGLFGMRTRRNTEHPQTQ